MRMWHEPSRMPQTPYVATGTIRAGTWPLEHAQPTAQFAMSPARPWWNGNVSNGRGSIARQRKFSSRSGRIDARPSTAAASSKRAATRPKVSLSGLTVSITCAMQRPTTRRASLSAA